MFPYKSQPKPNPDGVCLWAVEEGRTEWNLQINSNLILDNQRGENRLQVSAFKCTGEGGKQLTTN
jgi:hypothetical protein